MRFVVARRLGRRGEGLGNEMLPWAKGLIASHVLKARFVGPSWGINKRKYYQHFGTSRLDFVVEDMLSRLPHHEFTHTDYLATGAEDFGDAISQWSQAIGLASKRSFIVTVAGMYGGFSCIRDARPFLLGKLLNSRDAIRNVYDVASKLDRDKLFVAVHMRFGGDFDELVPSESARGRYNIRISGSWYLSVCEQLQKEFGDKLQFHFFTDRRGPEFDEAVRRFNPGQRPQTGLTECSDLLLMAQADLRICSISSYSMVACFLSSGPYIWYEPQLTVENDLYTMWGMEDAQRIPGSLTQRSIDFVKGIDPSSVGANEFTGYAMECGVGIPCGLVAQLRRRLRSNRREVNLIEYGCLPHWTRSTL